MEIVQDPLQDQQEIESMSICKGALNFIFLSDITTADGQKLQSFGFDPGCSYFSSTYSFPHEEPMAQDWECWRTFWNGYTDEGGVIKIPLGR